MDARLLTRCTNTVLVAAVGMGAGHLLMPTRPGEMMYLRRAGFVAAVAAVGALAGMRERVISREYAGRAAGPLMPSIVGGAGLALALAAIAWLVVHG